MEKKLNYLFKKDIYNIYILRHPQVANHADNVFNGGVDVDLSDEGYRQAESLYGFFQDKNIGLVISSPLRRCRVVAEKFQDKTNVVFDERIKERNFGVFESLSWNSIEKKYPNEAKQFLDNPFGYRVEGGESFLDVKKRVVDFIEDRLAFIESNILIVAHGGVNRVFISHMLDMNEKAILKISQDYACINHFQSDGSFVLCRLINGKVGL